MNRSKWIGTATVGAALLISGCGAAPGAPANAAVRTSAQVQQLPEPAAQAAAALGMMADQMTPENMTPERMQQLAAGMAQVSDTMQHMAGMMQAPEAAACGEHMKGQGMDAGAAMAQVSQVAGDAGRLAERMAAPGMTPADMAGMASDVARMAEVMKQAAASMTGGMAGCGDHMAAGGMMSDPAMQQQMAEMAGQLQRLTDGLAPPAAPGAATSPASPAGAHDPSHHA